MCRIKKRLQLDKYNIRSLFTRFNINIIKIILKWIHIFFRIISWFLNSPVKHTAHKAVTESIFLICLGKITKVTFNSSCKQKSNSHSVCCKKYKYHLYCCICNKLCFLNCHFKFWGFPPQKNKSCNNRYNQQCNKNNLYNTHI